MAFTPRSGRRTPETGLLSSPSVRRRPSSPTATPVKTEPTSTTPPTSPLPPPSEATESKVARLQDSVAHVVGRELLRPPVYTAPQLSPTRDQPRVTECCRLGIDFWNQLGGDASRRRHTGPLSEEHRRKLLYAVMSLETKLSSAGYPSSDVLRHLLRCCTETGGETRRCCLQVLRRVAYLHPPHGRQMRRLYRDVLSGPEPDWQPLGTAIERCLSSTCSETPTREDHLFNTELLELLVSLLEEDISFWWRSNRGRVVSVRLQHDPPAALPLLAGLLWRSDQQAGSSVAATRQLCSWLVKAHGPRPAGVDMTTRRLLLRLIAMAAEFTRIKGQRSFLHVTDDMETLAGDLSRAVQEQHLDSSAVIELLSSLRPAWLVARLASARLHERYARKRLTGPLTLQLIHANYLSEKENRMPQTDGVTTSGSSGENGVSEAMPLAPKRELQSPTNGSAKRRKLGGRGSRSTEEEGDAEYSTLLYHLLCAHLLHTGVTDVRVLMTVCRLRETLKVSPVRPTSADHQREVQRARDLLSSCDASFQKVSDLVTYRRELEFIQDRLWRGDTAFFQLNAQYEQYMRSITKL